MLRRIVTILATIFLIVSPITAHAYADGGNVLREQLNSDKADAPGSVSQQYLLSNIVKVNEYEPNHTYSDIADTAWYTEAAAFVYEHGMMEGKPNNTFDPKGYVTIGEVLTMAFHIHAFYKYGEAEGKRLIESYNSTSNSVGQAEKANRWEAALQYCDAEGLFNISELSEFEYRKYQETGGDYTISAGDYYDFLNLPTTRAQMVHIMAKTLQPKDMTTQNTVEGFPDTNANTNYYSDIVLFYETGIVGGVDSDGTFNPDRLATRAEAATMILNLIDVSRRQSGRTYGSQSNNSWEIVSFSHVDTQFYTLDNEGNLWTWGEEESWWDSTNSELGRTQPKILIDNVSEYYVWREVCWVLRNDDSLWIWHKGYPYNDSRAYQSYAAPQESMISLCTPYLVAENVLRVIGAYRFIIEKKDGSIWGLAWEPNPWDYVPEVGNTLVPISFTSLYPMLPFQNIEDTYENVESMHIYQNDGVTIERITRDTYVLTDDGKLWLNSELLEYFSNEPDWQAPNDAPQMNPDNFSIYMDQVSRIYIIGGRNLALRHDGSLCYWGSGFHWLTPDTVSEPVTLLSEVIDAAIGENCYMILDSAGRLWYWGFYNQGYPNGMNSSGGSDIAEYFVERQQAGARLNWIFNEPELIAENVRSIHKADSIYSINLFLPYRGTTSFLR